MMLTVLVRLNKYLALCGVASRRGCDALILQGAIRVNQEVVTELGRQISPDKDEVWYQEKKVVPFAKRYFIFYKPVGVLTTHFDPFERKDLNEFLKDIDERLFSVGRLDMDSEGLLLLTNDGDLAHRLQHPKYKIPKTYHIWTDRNLSEEEKQRFEKGILLTEGWTQKAKIRNLSNKNYEVILKQGWKRQIRRMLESLGVRVTRLKRVSIGSLNLGDLRPGEKKEISEDFFYKTQKKF